MVLGDIDLEILQNFGIAILIGAFMGVERERRGDDTTFGGFRTFILLATLGALLAWLSVISSSVWPMLVGLAAVSAIVVASYATTVSEQGVGITTESAALVVYVLGAGTVYGHPEVTVPIAIVATAVLAFKTPLHDFAAKIGRDDMAAALQLLFATFIVLPLLPDHTVDPLDALNPYKLWWLVILISGLSLVGYIAVRILGPGRGTAITGLAGGLVSSTAATLGFARESKQESALPDLVSMGILLAWTVMFVRILIEVAVVNPSLVPAVAVPIGVMGVASGIALSLFWWRGKRAENRRESDEGGATTTFKNPFSLTEAIKFGLMFAAVLLLVAALRGNVADEWMYLLAAIAGATDVDAIALSLANPSNGLDPVVAARGITLAALSNTVVKATMAASLGSAGVRVRILVATAGLLVGGIGGMILL
jgi:uncharacterized membrane protein (DUF4010 family)